MPLLKFHVYKGWSREGVATLLDTAHNAMVRSFEVPERDHFQIVHKHAPDTMVVLDTGLDIPRSNRFVLVEVVSRPRTTDQKQAFYSTLCHDLHQRCDILPSGLMISFLENSDADWSFGHDRAQFLTGEL